MDDETLNELFSNDKTAFIQALLEEFGIDAVANAYSSVNKINGIKLELVHATGGGEGEGEHVERVVKVTKDDQSFFVEFTGSYSSYCGTEYDDVFIFVEPREVLVTQYFPI